MGTTTVNIAANTDFYSRNKDELLFPQLSSCTEPPTTTNSFPLDASKDIKGKAQPCKVSLRHQNHGNSHCDWQHMLIFTSESGMNCSFHHHHDSQSL
jgi:hypothetical protein